MKWVKAAGIGAAAIVLLVFLGIRLLSPGKPTLAKQSVERPPATSELNEATNTRQPSASAQAGAGRLAAVNRAQQTTASPAVRAAVNSNPDVDSQLMNDQLTASPLIPKDIKTTAKEEAPPPPGFGAASANELASTGAIGGVFSDQGRPAVQYAPDAPAVISSADAERLLLWKKAPAYPPKAWKYYISGKVVLEAVISKTGSVKTLKVLSGRPEFEQAALDAVRTWRYKPFLLNNQPAEFQTTISLKFDPDKR